MSDDIRLPDIRRLLVSLIEARVTRLLILREECNELEAEIEAAQAKLATWEGPKVIAPPPRNQAPMGAMLDPTLPRTSKRSAKRVTYKRVTDILMEHGPMTKRKLAEHLGTTPNNCSAIYLWFKNGQIVRLVDGRIGLPPVN